MSKGGIALTQWNRVTRSRPCPVCGKGDWCLTTGPEGSPSAAICARMESRNRRGEAGWLHKLRDDGGWRRVWRSVRSSTKEDQYGPRTDFAALAAEYRQYTSGSALCAFAKSLGLRPETLDLFGVGWSPLHQAWSFPMRDGTGRVIGIHLRSKDGRKRSVTGSKLGLFIPETVLDGAAFVCEGMSDAAALVEMGFPAVGRASCSTGGKFLVTLLRERNIRHVIVVSDNDAPGQRGALALSCLLRCCGATVRIITPPEGFKDIRAWYRSGATKPDVLELALQEPARRMTVRIIRVITPWRKPTKRKRKNDRRK